MAQRWRSLSSGLLSTQCGRAAHDSRLHARRSVPDAMLCAAPRCCQQVARHCSCVKRPRPQMLIARRGCCCGMHSAARQYLQAEACVRGTLKRAASRCGRLTERRRRCEELLLLMMLAARGSHCCGKRSAAKQHQQPAATAAEALHFLPLSQAVSGAPRKTSKRFSRCPGPSAGCLPGLGLPLHRQAHQRSRQETRKDSFVSAHSFSFQTLLSTLMGLLFTFCWLCPNLSIQDTLEPYFAGALCYMPEAEWHVNAHQRNCTLF